MKIKLYKHTKKIKLIAALFLSSSIAFSQATLSVRVNAATDDMEEYTGDAPLAGALVAGQYDEVSSDLEIGLETPGNPARTSQLIGLRFNNILIPKGTIINNAYIQFTGDAGKNQDPSVLTIKGEAADNAVTFNIATPFNLSSRLKTNSSVTWNIPAGAWTGGLAGVAQKHLTLKQLCKKLLTELVG